MLDIYRAKKNLESMTRVTTDAATEQIKSNRLMEPESLKDSAELVRRLNALKQMVNRLSDHITEQQSRVKFSALAIHGWMPTGAGRMARSESRRRARRSTKGE